MSLRNEMFLVLKLLLELAKDMLLLRGEVTYASGKRVFGRSGGRHVKIDVYSISADNV